MRKTTVSSGSRRQSHNLDDLFDRWLLSIEEYKSNGFDIEFPVPIKIPDDLIMADKLYSDYKIRYNEILAKLAEYKTLESLTPFQTLRRKMLLAESAYLRATFAHFKVKRIELHNLRKTNSSQEKEKRIAIRAEQFKQALLTDQSHRGYDDPIFELFLECYRPIFEASHTLEYGPAEFAVLDTIQQYLRTFGDKINDLERLWNENNQ